METTTWIKICLTLLAMSLFVCTGCSKDDPEEPIVKVESVKLNKSSLTLVEGDSETLEATISPSDAINKKVSWESSNVAVATVEDGKVTAVKFGKATITVTTEDGGKTSTCEVAVADKAIAVADVKLDKSTLTLMEKESDTLIATITPDDATNKGISWKSSDKTIATVEEGKVTAIKAGKASITVTTEDGEKTATCEVTVNDIIDIPDANFKECLIRHFDTNKDGEISIAETKNITSINCQGDFIQSLEGIQYFADLRELDCSYNELTTLDLSKSTKLIFLSCNKNNLTTLDVSNNTKLEHLSCYENDLSALDISNNAMLLYLDCGSNKLASLDVSKSIKLVELSCYRNQITTLDLSKNVELQDLVCNENNLSTLELSGNTKLMTLSCHHNQITTLDLSKNTELKKIYCFRNQLSTLELSTHEKLLNIACGNQNEKFKLILLNRYQDKWDTEWSKEDNNKNINVTYYFINIPDAVFKNDLLAVFDINRDGEISVVEAENITSINCREHSIQNLDGIEYFINLKQLFCSKNNLTTLDVSKNTNLIKLECNGNRLATLDLSKNTELKELDCHNNLLTKLDVSKNTELLYLYCDINQLTSLDVSKNTELKELECYKNLLTKLDVSKNTKLTRLVCFGNQITELDVSKNTELTRLTCSDNQIAELDVSKNTKLMGLFCEKNQLNTLDLSKNIELTELLCNNNQLASLYLSKSTELQRLHCQANQLTALDVLKNTKLRWLDCSNNQLNTLNLSEHNELIEIACGIQKEELKLTLLAKYQDVWKKRWEMFSYNKNVSVTFI